MLKTTHGRWVVYSIRFAVAVAIATVMAIIAFSVVLNVDRFGYLFGVIAFLALGFITDWTIRKLLNRKMRREDSSNHVLEGTAR